MSTQVNSNISKLYSALKTELPGLNQQILCAFLSIEFDYSISSGHFSKLKKFDVNARYRRDISRDKYEFVKSILIAVLENFDKYRGQLKKMIDQSRNDSGEVDHVMLNRKVGSGMSDYEAQYTARLKVIDKETERASNSLRDAQSELLKIDKLRIQEHKVSNSANFESMFLGILDSYLWSLPTHACVLSLSTIMIDDPAFSNSSSFNVEGGFGEFVRKKNGRLKHMFLIPRSLDNLTENEALVLCNHMKAYGLLNRITGSGVYVLEFTEDIRYGLFNGIVPVSWLVESGNYTRWEFHVGHLRQIQSMDLDSGLGKVGFNELDDFFDVLMINAEKLGMINYKRLKQVAGL